jgi:hypothetical protein
MERIALGEPAAEGAWDRAFRDSYHARTRFYEAARRELGIAGGALPASEP